MFRFLEKLLTLFGARWRWGRGRCPRCSRSLRSTFAYIMADDPNCPVCRNETHADLRLWHKFKALGRVTRPAVAGVSSLEQRSLSS